jgi:membrane protein
MALNIDSSRSGRAGLTFVDGGDQPPRPAAPGIEASSRLWAFVTRQFWWMVHGYQRANAGDLAAAVAFHALVALIPTFLLCLAVAGFFLRVDQVLITAIYASLWGLPPEASSDALEAALTARRASGWLATLSLVGFAWAGTSFVGCLARSMNRIYGVPGCGFMCEKRRGFFVIVGFAVLFMLALLSSTIPTLFVRQDLPQYFQSWALAAGRYQAVGYFLAFGSTCALFAMLYRVVPNAGQRMGDIWPGTITASVLFVIMAQIFPIYFRALGGITRYGAVFGLISLLVAWFYVMAHVLLFGAYVNATHQRRRKARSRAEGSLRPGDVAPGA